VAEREEAPARGGVARDGGDGGHGQREEVGGEQAERGDELAEARAGSARPPDVEAVGEEAALADGHERAPGPRLGRALRGGGDGGAERGDEGVAQPVLAVAGEGEDEYAAALLQGAHRAGGWGLGAALAVGAERGKACVVFGSSLLSSRAGALDFLAGPRPNR